MDESKYRDICPLNNTLNLYLLITDFDGVNLLKLYRFNISKNNIVVF